MKTTLAENLRSVEIKKKISGIRIGRIHSIDEAGQILVDFPGNTAGAAVGLAPDEGARRGNHAGRDRPRGRGEPAGALPARFVESIKQKLQRPGGLADERVLIVFENGDPYLPIIIDIICDGLQMPQKTGDIDLQVTETDEVFVDGRRVTFDASEQIELRCGKASITLTRTGKVLIRGAYLLSRSSGANRIKGGSVQLN